MVVERRMYNPERWDNIFRQPDYKRKSLNVSMFRTLKKLTYLCLSFMSTISCIISMRCNPQRVQSFAKSYIPVTEKDGSAPRIDVAKGRSLCNLMLGSKAQMVRGSITSTDELT